MKFLLLSSIHISFCVAVASYDGVTNVKQQQQQVLRSNNNRQPLDKQEDKTTTVKTINKSSNENHQQHQRRLIIGGLDVDPARYPYFARLDLDGTFICGAALVESDFILTAAHCAFPEDLGKMTVTIGTYDLDNDDTTDIVREVTAIYRHPAYDDWSIINDFALLKIEPVPDDHPKIKMNADRREPKVGDPLQVIGLGLTSVDGDKAEFLKEVTLNVVEDEVCDIQYDGEIHHKSMICAAKDDKDSCSGDSGGPLIALGESYADDVQVGVVSFGESCANADFAGVYAEVAYARNWIDAILCTHSVNAPNDCERIDNSIIIGANETCIDYPGAFYASWFYQFQRCDWLTKRGRVSSFCYVGNEAWLQCPFTCHACTYEADDDFPLYPNADLDEYDFTTSSSYWFFLIVCIMSCIFCCQLCWCALNGCRCQSKST